jgi:hypothetical protein
MKSIILPKLISCCFLIVICFSACEKEIPPPPSSNNSYGNQTGQISFYTKNSSDIINCGNITITVDGSTRYITDYYFSDISNCGMSGCATFNLTPGTYYYSATNNCGDSWNTTPFTITSGGCIKRELL